MRKITIILFVALLLGGRVVRAQGPTETPTPTETPVETPTETPTATATLTNTPDLYIILTLQPSGRAGAMQMTITAGEAAIFTELIVVIVLLFFGVFLTLRRK